MKVNLKHLFVLVIILELSSCCRSKITVKRKGAPCPLNAFKNKAVYGYQGMVVRVEEYFIPSMVLISKYAQECNVKVLVTSSYRTYGVPINGSIVPQANHSNHYVGHAIDMNLLTENGLCNSVCLRSHTNEWANCFIAKVKTKLRWGGDFEPSDPVHIDDNLYLTNPGRWWKLYAKLQPKCQKKNLNSRK